MELNNKELKFILKNTGDVVLRIDKSGKVLSLNNNAKKYFNATLGEKLLLTKMLYKNKDISFTKLLNLCLKNNCVKVHLEPKYCLCNSKGTNLSEVLLDEMRLSCEICYCKEDESLLIHASRLSTKKFDVLKKRFDKIFEIMDKTSNSILWHYGERCDVFVTYRDLNRMFGFSKNQKVGFNDYLRLIDGKDSARVRREFSSSLKSRKDFETKYRINLADGKKHDINVATYYDVGDSESRAFGFLRDVSDESQCREETEAEKQKYFQLAEALPIPMIVHDGRDIFFLNGLGKKMLNVSDVSKTKEIYSYVLKEDLPRLRKGIAKIKSGKRVGSNTYTIVNGKNELKVDGSTVPIIYEGKKAFLTLCQDITERFNLESRLKRNLEMEELLLRLSKKIYTAKSVEEAITYMAFLISEEVSADRCCVFELDYSANTAKKINTWGKVCRNKKKCSNNLSISDLKYAISRMKRDGYCVVNDLSKLSDKHSVLKKYLLKSNVKSFISAPIFRNENVVMFLCFESITKTNAFSDIERNIISASAGYLTNFFERQGLIDTLEEQNKFSLDIINRMPLFIIGFDVKGRILVINDFAKSSIGYSVENLNNMKDFILKTSPEINYTKFMKLMKGLKKNDSMRIRKEMMFKSKIKHSTEWIFRKIKLPSESDEVILSIGQDISEIVQRNNEKKELDKQLHDRLEELEKYYNLTVDRELYMVGLKKELEKARRENKK